MPSKIKKRGKDSYLLTVAAGYDAKGKQFTHTKTVKCSSDREAEKQYALFVAEVERGETATSGKMTLADFVVMWLEKHVERQLTPKTIETYRNLLIHWIVPALGHIRLDKLKPLHILDFYANLEESGIRKDGKPGCLSGRTRLQIHVLLHTVLDFAVKWGYLTVNPAEKVDAPKAERTEKKIFDEEQTAAFILSLDNTELKWKVLSLLAFTTGLRVGELVGLEWKHIDLDKQTLLVKQTTQYVSGKGLITKAPKTESSRRVIALSGNIVELLKHYRADQNTERLKLGDRWIDNDRLFTAWDGRPMYPGSFTRWIGEFCVKNNLPHISPHSLRHLSATILINHGVSLKNISARLGHSQTSITGNIYTHFLKSADQAAADKMEDVLKSIADTTPKTKKKQV